MSELQRAYDLLRGYVNREWDRIRSVDLDKAWQELQSPSPAQKTTEAEEGVQPAPNEPMDKRQLACSVLGVGEDASFEEIRKAFDRLNKRSNPANFPEESEEYANASKIQARVNWAYRVLTDDKSGSEMRFKSLEID